jgi:hypothetical protein
MTRNCGSRRWRGATSCSASGRLKSSANPARTLKPIRAVSADFEEAGDEDVFRKIRKDFDAAGVDQSDHRIRRTMDELLSVAIEAVRTGR